MSRLFGPIPPTAIHLVVDMQELFRSHPDWGSSCLTPLVRPIRKLLAARPDNACFSRFVPPRRSDEAERHWGRYYRRWHRVTMETMAPGLVEIIHELRPWAKRLIDKPGYSALVNGPFRTAMQAQPGHCLILSGVETDVCVLSTVMEAMELGLRTIIASDAVASSIAACHDHAMRILEIRYDEQVEIATADEIIAAWTDGATP